MFDKLSEDGEGWIVVGFIPTNCSITLEQDQYKVIVSSGVMLLPFHNHRFLPLNANKKHLQKS